MRPLDLLLYAAVCLIWALNLIVSRVLFSELGVAPIFYAAARFLIVAAILAPLLRPLPRPLLPILVIGFLMGACHFGLMFLGLTQATSSSVSIVLQTAIPITALLSVLLLGERVGPARGAGIALALGGVVLVMWDGEGASVSLGLVFAFLSAVAISLAQVLLKRYGAIKPLTMQAWTAFVSAPPVLAYSLLAETTPVTASLGAGWPFLAALAFSVIAVTLMATTLYLGILQRYPASIVAPLGLMTPLMTVVMGILLLGEGFDLRMAVGGIIALIGLILVLRQQTPRAAEQPSEAT
ncbi:DMT family transporter [Devosia sp. ZB163]|uniref:DMT family transporter n=1 Tax=Devosia sp. ZB163 TaxID=3025938 RepID=UPI00235F0671|nr:DMT family transporter [Devosia sp. ZB163]MDC9826388.1 DMT family transporter [Devosia sp. ZB163]